jgi:hypothetical protein
MYIFSNRTEFFIDGLSVGKRTRYLKRKIKGYRKYKWRFGGPIPTYRGLFAKCTIGTWQIWTASKYIKDAVGVLSGKSTLHRAPKYDINTPRKFKIKKGIDFAKLCTHSPFFICSCYRQT